MKPPTLRAKNLLITYGWCRTSYVAAISLHMAGYCVYACDASGLAMTRYSRFVKGFNRVANPFRDPERYVKDLVAVVVNREIDMVIPGHEDGMIIRAAADKFPENVIIAAPLLHDYERANDKYEIIRVAREAGVNAPETFACRSIDEYADAARRLGFPLVVKTRKGNSGKGVYVTRSLDQTIAEVTRLIERYNLPVERWPVVQKYLPGGRLVGTCFIAARGELVRCFHEDYITCKEDGFGTSVYRERIVTHPLMDEYAKRMVRTLGWNGIGHFDYIANADMSEVALIEMNPRLWGALNLAVVNGYDFPKAFAELMTDGTIDEAAFCPVPVPCASMWIAGEIIACISTLQRHGVKGLIAFVKKMAGCMRESSFDDFKWNDPLPFVAEVSYYLLGFIRSGGKINPPIDEMMT